MMKKDWLESPARRLPQSALKSLDFHFMPNRPRKDAIT